ncbi:hypothetical protein AAG747_01235 [Rapidithrix thailandica]|uniref:Uncharacterized protein n=1 Tax=Rapidithrix thailandica TaxID=413964 RepID=A0AAW9S260_9BACT
MDRFWKGLIGLTILVVVAIIVLAQFTTVFIHPHTWYILGYQIFLSVFSYVIVLRGAKKGGIVYMNHVMGASTFRLLLGGIVLCVYYFTVQELRISFTVTFFALYFLFTLFEISTLLSKLRKISESVEKTDGKE